MVREADVAFFWSSRIYTTKRARFVTTQEENPFERRCSNGLACKFLKHRPLGLTRIINRAFKDEPSKTCPLVSLAPAETPRDQLT